MREGKARSGCDPWESIRPFPMNQPHAERARWLRYTVWRALGSERVQMSRQHLRRSETGRDSSREDHPQQAHLWNALLKKASLKWASATRMSGYFSDPLLATINCAGANFFKKSIDISHNLWYYNHVERRDGKWVHRTVKPKLARHVANRHY